MLVLQLYLFYFDATTAKLFEKQHVLELTYDLKDPQSYENSKGGRKLLVQPKEIVTGLDEIADEFSDCEMTVRKSDTSPLLRVTLQGIRSSCEKLKIKIDSFLKTALLEG
jgi:phosphomannomutase